MNGCLLHGSVEAASRITTECARCPRSSEPDRSINARNCGVDSERIMIDAFIAKHGVRRFESGASVSSGALHRFLATRGYVLSLHDEKNGRVRLFERNSSSKLMMWSDVLAFCDALRQSEGLEPFVRMSHPRRSSNVS